MFDRILIANRGEIACRIIRTCRRLGIHSIAVYSEADKHALHVSMADEAWLIGAAEPKFSYLDSAKIIEVAQQSHAQAIHPGYGFLSENTDFSRACRDAGIVFIGPEPESIELMGSKAEAKAVMEKHHVPVVPGYHGDQQDNDTLTNNANNMGYPLMIKAAWGGGGKGMRIVRKAEDFADELEAAKREAQGAFGNDEVILERYVEHPRHIEFQIFADNHGHVIHMNERECSAQRRFQKVMEETPSPFLTPALREKMGNAAVAAGQAVNYRGAGTVEFIVGKDGEFFFMEMNTRLQVEHPITEITLGLDLVEWQLRVANNETLPLSQEAIKAEGHAIEVRIYAEDPEHNFLPSSGVINRLDLPAPSKHVRLDGGVQTGDTVSIFYDPMIAKMIVHAANREQALQRMRHALVQSALFGPKSNIAFLETLINHPIVQQAEIDTGYLDRHLDQFIAHDKTPAAKVAALAALAKVLRLQQQKAQITPPSPWDATDNWRIGAPASYRFTFNYQNQHVAVKLHRDHNIYTAQLDDERILMQDPSLDNQGLHVSIDGMCQTYAIHQWHDQLDIHVDGQRYMLVRTPTHSWDDGTDTAANTVLAPMPGHIVMLKCAPGDKVSTGMPLVIMEAMKMELTLKAPCDGNIATINVDNGEFVDADSVLVEIDTGE